MALNLTATATSTEPVLGPLQAFVRVAGIAAVAVGTAVLLGWVFDVALLKSVIPGHLEMKANTALSFVACGMALLGARSPRPAVRRASAVLSGVVLLVGALTLAEYVSGIAFGIDTLLFADPASVAQGRPPGRMSQITAFAFLLVGALGMLVPEGRWPRLGQSLALVVAAIGLFALSAYGYAMGTVAGEAPFNPISVHTALLLLMLGLGWLAAQPEGGLMRVVSAPSFGGELARRTLLPALLIPALLSYGAQWLRHGELLSDGAIITLLAVSSGVAVAAMIWWASALLDRVETHRRVARHLRDSAHTDALTGLGNRRAFDGALRRLLDVQAAGEGAFSLLMLDLDQFKDYNDSFGHPAGDEALRQTGLLLGSALRPGDIACRYGGEEFAVLLPGTGANGAIRVAERIVHDMRGGLWLHRPITASIGATTARPGDDANGVVARADAALYDAKRGGRDRAVFRAEQ